MIPKQKHTEILSDSQIHTYENETKIVRAIELGIPLLNKNHSLVQVHIYERTKRQKIIGKQFHITKKFHRLVLTISSMITSIKTIEQLD